MATIMGMDNAQEPLKCEICHEDPAKHQYFDNDNRELYVCDKCFNKNPSGGKPKKEVKDDPPPDPADYPPNDDDEDSDMDPEEQSALCELIDFVLCKSCDSILQVCKKSRKFKKGFKVRRRDNEYDVLIKVKIMDDHDGIDVTAEGVAGDRLRISHHWAFKFGEDSIVLKATSKSSDEDTVVKYTKETITPSQLLFLISVIDSVCTDKKNMEEL